MGIHGEVMKKIKFLISKHCRKKTEREKAQAMVVAFIYVSVVALIAVYMITYAKNLHNVVIREIKHSMSFYAGEAALIRAYVALNTGTAFPTTMDGMTPMSVNIARDNIGNGVWRITATVNW